MNSQPSSPKKYNLDLWNGTNRHSCNSNVDSKDSQEGPDSNGLQVAPGNVRPADSYTLVSHQMYFDGKSGKSLSALTSSNVALEKSQWANYLHRVSAFINKKDPICPQSFIENMWTPLELLLAQHSSESADVKSEKVAKAAGPNEKPAVSPPSNQELFEYLNEIVETCGRKSYTQLLDTIFDKNEQKLSETLEISEIKSDKVVKSVEKTWAGAGPYKKPASSTFHDGIQLPLPSNDNQESVIPSVHKPKLDGHSPQQEDYAHTRLEIWFNRYTVGGRVYVDEKLSQSTDEVFYGESD